MNLCARNIIYLNMVRYCVRIEPHYIAEKGSIIVYHDDPEGNYLMVSSGENTEKKRINIEGVIGSSHSFSFPQICPCCLSPADTTHVVSHTVSDGGRISTTSWKLPYCSECIQHATLSKSLLSSFISSRKEKAKNLLKESCASLNWAVEFLGSEEMKPIDIEKAGPRMMTINQGAEYKKPDQIILLRNGGRITDFTNEGRSVHIFIFGNHKYAQDFIKFHGCYESINEYEEDRPN